MWSALIDIMLFLPSQVVVLFVQVKDASIEAKSSRSRSNSNTQYIELKHETVIFAPTEPIPGTDANCEAQTPDLRPYVSPFDWPRRRKTVTLCLTLAAAVATAYTPGAYSPPASQMAKYWDVSEEAILVGITTFTLGFAVAPMILAPLSEINGRQPVFIATGALFVVGQICCAATRTYAGMLVARFFTGAGGSAFSTMVGGVISDMYHHEDRNTPMALFAGATVFGSGLGPLCSGFVAYRLFWRWVFWLQTIICGITIAIVIVFFKETRGSVLLSRKAKCLNRYLEAREKKGVHAFEPAPCRDTTERSVRFFVRADEDRESIRKMIAISCYRPFHLLFTEPVVFFFSLWASFSWSVLYLTFSAVPLVFSAIHNFNVEQTGTIFAAVCIGTIFQTLISIYQEEYAKQKGQASATPEARLRYTCYQSVLLPIGLFWFGWTSYSSVPWLVPTLGLGCATMGILAIYLAVFNYITDTYHRYASSALAAQSFSRNTMGGIFPIITHAMFTRLGFQGASSLLGALGAVLTLIPWILSAYGTRIRARSKFASELLNE